MTTSNVQIQAGPETAPQTSGGCGCGGCGCGGGQAADPVLDIHAIPRQIRAGAFLGALASIPPGAAMVLLAPHEPRRLLAQADATFPGLFDVTYPEATPEQFLVRFARRA